MKGRVRAAGASRVHLARDGRGRREALEGAARLVCDRRVGAGRDGRRRLARLGDGDGLSRVDAAGRSRRLEAADAAHLVGRLDGGRRVEALEGRAGARGDGRLERHRTARGAVVERRGAPAGRRVGAGRRAGELGVHLRVAALRVDGLRVGHAGRRAKAELNLHRRLVEIERVVVGDLRVRKVAVDALVRSLCLRTNAV